MKGRGKDVPKVARQVRQPTSTDRRIAHCFLCLRVERPFAYLTHVAGDYFSRLLARQMSISSISAITMATHDMSRSVQLYQALGFELDDVDAFYRHVLANGLTPDFAPSDAPWG